MEGGRWDAVLGYEATLRKNKGSLIPGLIAKSRMTDEQSKRQSRLADFYKQYLSRELVDNDDHQSLRTQICIPGSFLLK